MGLGLWNCGAYGSETIVSVKVVDRKRQTLHELVKRHGHRVSSIHINSLGT